METGVEVTGAGVEIAGVVVEAAGAGAGVEAEAPNVNRELDVTTDVVAAPKVDVVVSELPNLNIDVADVETGAALPNPPNSGAFSMAAFFNVDASGAEELPKAKGEDLFDDPSSAFPNKERPDGGTTAVLFTSSTALTLSALDSKLEMGLVGDEITVVGAMDAVEAPILVDVERLKIWDPKLGVDIVCDVLSDTSGILKLTSGAIVFFDISDGAPNEKVSFFAGSKLLPKLVAFGVTSFWSFSVETDSPALSKDEIANLDPAASPRGLLDSVDEPNLNPAVSPQGLLGSIVAPNLNPAGSLEDLLGSNEDPNLNPTDSLDSAEAPNLNPVDPPEDLLDSTEAPNLKLGSSLEGLLVSVADPNLNPVGSSEGLLVSTAAPNLNPLADSGFSSADAGLTPNLNSFPVDFLSATAPNLKAAIAGETVGFDPGRGVSQELH